MRYLAFRNSLTHYSKHYGFLPFYMCFSLSLSLFILLLLLFRLLSSDLFGCCCRIKPDEIQLSPCWKCFSEVAWLPFFSLWICVTKTLYRLKLVYWIFCWREKCVFVQRHCDKNGLNCLLPYWRVRELSKHMHEKKKSNASFSSALNEYRFFCVFPPHLINLPYCRRSTNSIFLTVDAFPLSVVLSLKIKRYGNWLTRKVWHNNDDDDGRRWRKKEVGVWPAGGKTILRVDILWIVNISAHLFFFPCPCLSATQRAINTM